MSMIKALFFDLDGTLLTSGKSLSPATVSALQNCRSRGLRLYIATGRSPHLDKTLGWTEDVLALFDGGVFSNGACVMQGGTPRWARIAPDAVRACVDIANRHGVNVSLHMDDGMHAFNFTLPRSVWGFWGVTEGSILPLDESAFARTVKLLFFHEYLKEAVTPLPPALLTHPDRKRYSRNCIIRHHRRRKHTQQRGVLPTDPKGR